MFIRGTISFYVSFADMKVYGVDIPSDRGLTNFDIQTYINILTVPNFRGVFMRDELPKIVKPLECGIMNFNTHEQIGSHWVCYMRNGKTCIYFELNIPYLEMNNLLLYLVHNQDCIQDTNHPWSFYLQIQVMKWHYIG